MLSKPKPGDTCLEAFAPFSFPVTWTSLLSGLELSKVSEVSASEGDDARWAMVVPVMDRRSSL